VTRDRLPYDDARAHLVIANYEREQRRGLEPGSSVVSEMEIVLLGGFGGITGDSDDPEIGSPS